MLKSVITHRKYRTKKIKKTHLRYRNYIKIVIFLRNDTFFYAMTLVFYAMTLGFTQ